MKNIEKYMDLACVPLEHREAIQACLSLARSQARGLLWHKIKARLWYPRIITKSLDWHSNYLDPDHPLADYGVEPVANITVNGDNPPWGYDENGMHCVPQDFWTNTDPDSQEYQEAVAHCYWAKGHHPRSKAARLAWFRRNGGAALAYRRGLTIHNPGVNVWGHRTKNLHVQIIHTDGVYCVNVERRVLGDWFIVSRKGFEVDNVGFHAYDRRNWLPLYPGQIIKAPVTWSVLLRRINHDFY